MTLQEVLRERFGLAAFRPGQEAVIEALMAGRGALAVFPTGGGKSLCYQLPALLLDGVTLVVSPLIALMKDQIDFLQGRGIAAARLDSSLSAEEHREVTGKLRSGHLKLLYVAPERFNNERFRSLLQQVKIALFAVDEAHCISEWGHNFRPDYLKLADFARAFRAERVLALTATATPRVVEDICDNFAISRQDAVVTGFFRPNLALLTTPVRAAERDRVLVQRLRDRPAGTTIVYVTLQRTAERVADMLADVGLPAKAYHAGLDDDVRTAVQEWWQASDAGIVVATVAFGMGIDKAAVRYVYHYNLPKSLESWSQEIGRAGRDRQPSIVEMLACLEDVPVLENFAYGDTPARSALRSLVGELLLAGSSFEVNPTSLANRHDLRQLVLRTALTYLELQGLLRQGTPSYASYQARPLKPMLQIANSFQGERAQFIADIFARAKEGRLWYTLDPAHIATALKQDRARIVSALEYLAQQRLIELRAADVRLNFTRLGGEADPESLTEDLARRFEQRERQEVARLQDVLELLTHDGCQANALASYFGEQRVEPCGQCSFCRSGQRLRLHEPAAPPPLATRPELDRLAELRQAHPAALGEPRQMARFACGLTSPALTTAKLSRHPDFGVFEDYRFRDVLDWAGV
ncbi:MAG TPA: RecQ family ATP-dependent DNA helicase [Chloroflexota bacterium]